MSNVVAQLLMVLRGQQKRDIQEFFGVIWVDTGEHFGKEKGRKGIVQDQTSDNLGACRGEQAMFGHQRAASYIG